MLKLLKIQNLVIIDAAEIPFGEGLNILSGETGAGKSMVLDAIGLILGERANTDLIRTGCEEATVEGLFEISEAKWIKKRLEAAGLDANQDELCIKRIIHRTGKNRIWINGSLATLSMLGDLCQDLIEICGQHEHQSLARPSVQLELLDRYGGLNAKRDQYEKIYRSFHEAREQFSEFGSKNESAQAQADFIAFQIEELKAAQILPNEEASLQEEKLRLSSVSTRQLELSRVISQLDGSRDDDSGLGAISQAQSALNQMKAWTWVEKATEKSTANWVSSLNQAVSLLSEVSMELNRRLDQIEADPQRLEDIHERLSFLQKLKRKYGATTDAMLEKLEALEQQSANFENAEGFLKELQAKIDGLRKELLQIAKELSQSRKKVARTFADSVTAELKDLRMQGARIELALKTDTENPGPVGCDHLDILAQTNPGESPKELGKIASGGELSRLMLAIRRVISEKGRIGVYLFDEIDAGIGGQTAFEVGKKLASVAKHNQVICITHLPQVAAFADHHLRVEKCVEKHGKQDRTFTVVESLAMKERQEEIARMLAGSSLTRKSLENASELMKLAERSI